MTDHNAHDADPIKDAWSEVADRFSALGRSMKERFERDPEPEDPAARGGDPTAALREAFDALIAAGRDLGDKVTGLTRDDTLKGQARQVGTSINQALEATVNQITGEMRSFFKGSTPDAETVVDASTAEEVDHPTATDDSAGDPADGDDDTPTSGAW